MLLIVRISINIRFDLVHEKNIKILKSFSNVYKCENVKKEWGLIWLKMVQWHAMVDEWLLGGEVWKYGLESTMCGA